jgi:glycosyltransferase involved in cell wall biosynthesis
VLQDLIRREGLEEYVELLGFSEDVDTHLRAADVYLQTSDWEPLGMGILEALQLGKRVVSTDCAGPSELLRDNIGWLTPRGDAEKFGQAILMALRAPPFDQRRRERAEEYSLARGLPTLLSVLRG